MTYRYYSQHGEDFLLWHFFNFRRSGFFSTLAPMTGLH